MSEQNYISRQITVYKTDKKLIEFIDKLKPAPGSYTHLGRQCNSTTGI